MGNAPDALLRLKSRLMQGQIRPHGDDSVIVDIHKDQTYTSR